MKYQINYHTCKLCICIFVFCSPFIFNASPAQDVIYQPNHWHQKGIWISDINGHNPRRLFNPPIIASKISIRQGDRYILCVGSGIKNESGVDVYLFDRQNLNKGRKDLTYGRFSIVSDAAISPKGDVVFANEIFNDIPDGIYMIPKHEVHATLPKAEKLYDGPAGYVDWVPNGFEVVFSNDEGIFLLNINTKQVSKMLDYGYRPVFSPDGSRLAFFIFRQGQNNKKNYQEIGVISRDDPKDVNILKGTKTELFSKYLTWTPDGESVAYVLAEFKQLVFFWARFEFTSYVVSIEKDNPQEILTHIEGGVQVLEFTQKSYPVEPESKLTTTWGQLKQQQTNGGYHD